MDIIYLTSPDQQEPITLIPGTLLRIEHVDSHQIATTLVVGGKPDDFLVALPPVDANCEETLFAKPGDTILVSYMLEESMIRFSTTLREIAHHPIDMFLLDFPNDADRFELRSHKRINCFLASSIEIHNDAMNQSYKGTIRDISKTGCRCNFTEVDTHKDIFSAHEQITLRCKFPGIADEQETIGVVRDIRVDKEMVSIGIQFVETAWWVPPYDTGS